MRTKSTLSLLVCLSFTSIISCNQDSNKNKIDNHKTETSVSIKDYGAEPMVLNIEDYTSSNENFRTALWTGSNLQVTLMTIPVKGEVGLELHNNIDQFFRIEEGKARVMVGDTQDNMPFNQIAEADFAIFIPAGKWHNVINIGDKPLKLYTIYAPAEHPHGTIHKTQQESIDAHH